MSSGLAGTGTTAASSGASAEPRRAAAKVPARNMARFIC